MSEETIPQMRERIESLEKAEKAANERAEKAESVARLYQAKDVFRSEGYDPVHAELFVGQHGDGEITAELVGQFASRFGTPMLNKETTGTDTDSDDDSADSSDQELSNMGRAGSGSGGGGQPPAGSETMTHQEWMELNRKNPTAAREALRKGQVEFKEGNFYAQQLSR